MMEQFSRSEMLLGRAAILRLRASHVAVFGLGGVGGYAVEALARAGVGTLTLVDNDTVGITNLNRQLCALNSTLGQYKADVLARRAADINPDITVYPLCEYYCAENRAALESGNYDYIIDAIDIVSAKLDLICTAKAKGIPIISALGTGNKLDASLFRVADISKTEMCPLGRVIRRELKKRGILNHKVVYSPEKPLKPTQYGAPPPGRRSVPASVPWVPAAAGLMLAGEVARELAEL